MASHESPTTFDVDRLRDPFKHEAPQKIFRPPSLRDSLRRLFRGLSEQDFPEMRARMLKIAAQEFSGRGQDVLERSVTYGVPPYSPVDSAFVSVISTLEDSIRHVAHHDDGFRTTMSEYDRAHHGKGYANRSIQNGTDELIEFTRHGVGTMAALQEVLPVVYKRTYGNAVPDSELFDLLQNGADRILSSLTRMPGPYAVEIEKFLGKPDRCLGYEDISYKRPVFNPDHFRFREVQGKPVADLESEFVDFILETVHPSRIQYHGCLAGLVSVNVQHGDTTVKVSPFTYVKHVLAHLVARQKVQTHVD